MNTVLKFKTNLMCQGCKMSITPILNNTDGIEKWELDLQQKDKQLSVYSNGISASEVISILQEAGYRCEEIS